MPSGWLLRSSNARSVICSPMVAISQLPNYAHKRQGLGPARLVFSYAGGGLSALRAGLYPAAKAEALIIHLLFSAMKDFVGLSVLYSELCGDRTRATKPYGTLVWLDWVRQAATPSGSVSALPSEGSTVIGLLRAKCPSVCSPSYSNHISSGVCQGWLMIARLYWHAVNSAVWIHVFLGQWTEKQG